MGAKDGAGDEMLKWVNFDSKLKSLEDYKVINIRLPSDIIFDLGSATLRQNSLRILNIYASILKEAYYTLYIY